MHLKDRCRNLRSNRSEECILYSLCLVLAADYNQNLLCHHDGLDTHGIRLLRNLVDGREKSLICLNGSLLQIDTMSLGLKCFARLIESNMSVVSQAKKLQIHTAGRTDHFFISCTLFLRIQVHTVRKMSSLRINIHIVKQIMIHEIKIALIIFSRQSLVLVQIDRCYITKIQITLLIPFNELFVGSDRCGTGSQTQHTVWFHNDLCGNNVCCLTAHVVVIFCFNNFHHSSPSCSYFLVLPLF